MLVGRVEDARDDVKPASQDFFHSLAGAICAAVEIAGR